MLWRFLIQYARQFPKWALVFTILIVSTVLFLGWWTRFHHRDERKLMAEVAQGETRAKLEKIDRDPTSLILVNHDLYDLDTGALVFPKWFKEESFPHELFYDSDSKTMIGKFDHAFSRYDMSGERTAVLTQSHGVFFLGDGKSAIYVKGQDIWRAEIDWKNFTFINEHQVTSIEQFIGSSFPENVRLSTSNFLVVTNLMKVLRIDLSTGEVKQTRIPLTGLEKRRSPDGRLLVGTDGDQFFCYDVKSGAAKTIPVGRGKMNDYQWLNEDFCAMIAVNKEVIVYDRLKHQLTQVATLPAPCFEMSRPSPAGRFVFCAGRGRGYLVDLEQKTVVQAEGGSGIAWVDDQTFVFSKEVPDSDLRGTWMQRVGQAAARISPKPFLVGVHGPMMLRTVSGAILLATKSGISKMDQSAPSMKELFPVTTPLGPVIAIQRWIAP